MFRRRKPFILGYEDNGFVFQTSPPVGDQIREMEKSFARLFSSDEGRKVLGYLQAITFGRALGAGSLDSHLHYLEGQRALVASILRLIERGKKPN